MVLVPERSLSNIAQVKLGRRPIVAISTHVPTSGVAGDLLFGNFLRTGAAGEILRPINADIAGDVFFDNAGVVVEPFVDLRCTYFAAAGIAVTAGASRLRGAPGNLSVGDLKAVFEFSPLWGSCMAGGIAKHTQDGVRSIDGTSE